MRKHKSDNDFGTDPLLDDAKLVIGSLSSKLMICRFFVFLGTLFVGMGTAITGSWRVSFKRDDTFNSGLSTDIAKSIELRPVNQTNVVITEYRNIVQYLGSDTLPAAIDGSKFWTSESRMNDHSSKLFAKFGSFNQIKMYRSNDRSFSRARMSDLTLPLSVHTCLNVEKRSRSCCDRLLYAKSQNVVVCSPVPAPTTMSVTFFNIDVTDVFNPCDRAYSHVEQSLTILQFTEQTQTDDVLYCYIADTTYFWSSSVANSVFPPYLVWHSLTIPINSFSNDLAPSAFLLVFGKWFVIIALIARKLCEWKKKTFQFVVSLWWTKWSK